MIVVDIDQLSITDKQDLIRKLLDSLPEMVRKIEIERAKRIMDQTPVFILETPDGISIKASSVPGIVNAIASITGKTPDKSNIYKVIRGESKTVFGIKIKRYFEGDEQCHY